MAGRTRVLVVDDSAVMRRILTAILETDRGIEVIGIARNGEEAVEKVLDLRPDVVTLDINMPVMDGLTALAHVMTKQPTPVVMVSSLTQEGALATFEALELGAVDVIGKPGGTVSLDLQSQEREIVLKVRAAARARLGAGQRVRRAAAASAPRPAARPAPARATHPEAVAIGVSTGGPQTLMQILPELPAGLPAAVLVVQHMPPTFTAPFARRLDKECRLAVKEAEAGEAIQPGVVYVAPGGQHLTVARGLRGSGVVAQLRENTQGRTFCPSVDVLFESVARVYGRKAMGVLLTGMGDDGADGMVEIRQAGGLTIAESQETAVVFGMPREAIARGGAQEILPAYDVAGRVLAACGR